MEGFWKWLIRANAKGVFLCSWTALILVSAWWTWKQFSPLETEVWVPSLPSTKSPEGLGVLTFISNELNLEPEKDPVNPFKAFRVRAPRPDLPVKPGTKPKPGTGTKPVKPMTPSNPTPVPPTPTPSAPPPPPPPPPPKEMITLTYKGLLERPDGRILALFHDSKSNSSAFYHTGDALHGMRIKAVHNDSAELTLTDGSSVILHLKESKPFERGKHAD